MILRVDKLAIPMPPPSEPDPQGASVVQELLGGKFGELSTLMTYTFQSFNFRNRQGARPFYDLIAAISAEEFGHIELVATAINTMLTGAADDGDGKGEPGSPLEGLKDARNAQQYNLGGLSALPQDSNQRDWTGNNIFASGDLVQDLVHNFFLESGARSQKLRVYETVTHPAARALTGYLLVRGGVHQVAYARALENLTGADMTKLFPSPNIPTAKIPECQPFIADGEHLKVYRNSPKDYVEIGAVFNGPHPETGEPLEVVDGAQEGFPPFDLPPEPSVFAPGYAPEEIMEIAQKLRKKAGLPDEPTAEVANDAGGMLDTAKTLVDKVTP